MHATTPTDPFAEAARRFRARTLVSGAEALTAGVQLGLAGQSRGDCEAGSLTRFDDELAAEFTHPGADEVEAEA